MSARPDLGYIGIGLMGLVIVLVGAVLLNPDRMDSLEIRFRQVYARIRTVLNPPEQVSFSGAEEPVAPPTLLPAEGISAPAADLPTAEAEFALPQIRRRLEAVEWYVVEQKILEYDQIGGAWQIFFEQHPRSPRILLATDDAHRLRQRNGFGERIRESKPSSESGFPHTGIGIDRITANQSNQDARYRKSDNEC